MKVTPEWVDDLVPVIMLKKVTFACGILTFYEE
jgi:hypothetical protein